MIGDPVKPIHRWGVLLRSSNRLDGVTRHLVCNPDTGPFNFRTRREAKTWIDETYGYIRKIGRASCRERV